SARADANLTCRTSDMSYDDRWGRAGDSGHVMVFGEPVALVSPFFYMAGQINAVLKRISWTASLSNWNQIKNRQLYILQCLSMFCKQIYGLLLHDLVFNDTLLLLKRLMRCFYATITNWSAVSLIYD